MQLRLMAGDQAHDPFLGVLRFSGHLHRNLPDSAGFFRGKFGKLSGYFTGISFTV
jgi:hypothetical protein